VLLARPQHHGLVQFVDQVHQNFVLRIYNANVDAIRVLSREEQVGCGAHSHLLDQNSASPGESR
jgi:ADP-dependent phosphofructokinase/glucokinase